MPVNMILVMYVILCRLPYDFTKLTMLYIHVHISISMTNKSGLTFFLSIKYMPVCLMKKKNCLFNREKIKLIESKLNIVLQGGWFRRSQDRYHKGQQ